MRGTSLIKGSATAIHVAEIISNSESTRGLAAALVFLMEHFEADPKNPDDVFVNVGVGEDLSIKELAELIGEVVGYKGKIKWDSSMPDGTPQKLLDVSRMTKMGWKAKTPLKEGVHAAYNWYLENA